MIGHAMHDVHCPTYTAYRDVHTAKGVERVSLDAIGSFVRRLSLYFCSSRGDGRTRESKGCGVKMQINVEERGPRKR